MEIKHSVIVITYNQEKLIGRALDSLIQQHEHIYEIIVADDCSTDNNWQVIKEYQARFPSLIKPYQNEQNLGIFGNIETTWTKATGNVIWNLSGDDEYCPGVFEKANELILENGLNPEDNDFVILFDFKRMFSNGKSRVHSNSKVLKHNPISLKIRHLILNRTTGVSKSVYNSYFPVKKNIGNWGDALQDIQMWMTAKEVIYFPLVASLYYKSIGVTSKTDYLEGRKSYILSINELKNLLIDLSEEDLAWLTFLEKRLIAEISPSIKSILSCIKQYFKVRFVKYGYKHFIKQTIIVVYLLINFLYVRVNGALGLSKGQKQLHHLIADEFKN